MRPLAWKPAVSDGPIAGEGEETRRAIEVGGAPAAANFIEGSGLVAREVGGGLVVDA